MEPIASIALRQDGCGSPDEGLRRSFDGCERVYYCGYWIKTYKVPADTLSAKKNLIEALTRRLFNHTEHGLNVPGVRLKEARAAYESETDPDRRRVKAGMLAGALFNRAADIFRRLVELQADGVDVQSDYVLVKECGRCLMEALELGRQVLHRSGDEGIDELWGEPFRAFSLSIEDFYEGRYIKIGQCMRDIDRIAAGMTSGLAQLSGASIAQPLIREFADAARTKTETLRTDPEIFDVWSRFVTAGERLVNALPEDDEAQALVRAGRDLIFYIVRARTPMPKSTKEYLDRCAAFRRDRAPVALAPVAEG